MNPCRHPYIGCTVTWQNLTKCIRRPKVIKVDSLYFCNLWKVTKIRLEGFSRSLLVQTITMRHDHSYLSDGVFHKLSGQHTLLQHSCTPSLFMLLASVLSVLWEPLHCTSVCNFLSYTGSKSISSFFVAGLDIFEKYYQKIPGIH